MKKIFQYLMLASMMVSCNEKLEVDITQAFTNLTVDPATVNFPARPINTEKVTVTTSAKNWDFSKPETATWLTVEKQGNELYFTANENSGTAQRKADVSVSAGKAKSVTVQVTQHGNTVYYLEVEPTEISFEAKETTTKTATVITNAADWGFEKPASATWLNVAKDGNDLKFTPDSPNTGTSERKADVIVSATDAGSVIIRVTQAPFDPEPVTLEVDPTTIIFEAGETSVKMATVTTNADSWDYSYPVSATWLNVDKQENTLRFTLNSPNTGASQRSTDVIVTAGDANQVTVKVIQEPSSPPVVYNTAECHYWGDFFDTGTTNFDLWMFNSSDDDIGIRIEGFCTFNQFKNFTLDAGTYSLANNGNVRTFLPGNVENTTVYSTYLFNRHTGQYTLITGGTFTIAVSGSAYTISTSFTGENVNTGATVSDIRVNFSGQMIYINRTIPSFDNQYTYQATGTPGWRDQPGPTTWNGNFNSNKTGQFWEITNFGGSANCTIKAHYIDGEIVLDADDIVFETATDVGRLEFFVKYDGALHIVATKYWTVQYNMTTREMDFSGNIDINLGGSYGIVRDIPLQTGVRVFNKNTGVDLGWLTDVYPDIKLVLIPVSSPPAVRQSNMMTEGMGKMNVMTSKSVTVRKQIDTVSGVLTQIKRYDE